MVVFHNSAPFGEMSTSPIELVGIDVVKRIALNKSIVKCFFKKKYLLRLPERGFFMYFSADAEGEIILILIFAAAAAGRYSLSCCARE